MIPFTNFFDAHAWIFEKAFGDCSVVVLHKSKAKTITARQQTKSGNIIVLWIKVERN